ncbi:hypothetical protein CGLO_17336 [Colletotrichum gloeosporioides Cg-14]|uniref:Uncharacterized protein n=1 Tax=Colletotrichum gloeosporioides (strain Cg-14) TaxID=1237896 RepID=T0KX28_COLGC|nr:hypothetical protein CGLO_17336 [Colletotrichum gloeosporioides Cg-14]
MKPAVIKY